MKNSLPVFLYFGNYDRLPGKISINELRSRINNNDIEKGDEVFLALLEMVGTSPTNIDEIGTSEGLIAKLEGISNKITMQIKEYWSQNEHLRVLMNFNPGRPEDEHPFNNGYIFDTRIENTRHMVSVNFDERSSGFIWFFSFLIWFSQLANKYGSDLILLLDEPALSLHAKAQADWLRYINEKLKPKYQVIYTTHSPFMVDPDNLLSVRTVEDVFKGEEILGSKVGDKVLSDDPDTIFPLQAALGYDITQTLFVGEHCLLVEGPSDLLYLKWFSNELKKKGRVSLNERWVITPVGGIDKVSSFNKLFAGNKLHVAIFIDYHKGDKKKVQDLRKSDLLKQGHVFTADMYSGKEEADTEDMLGRALYVRLINETYNLDATDKLPAQKPKDAPNRVIEEVKNHMRLLYELPLFDHYTPAPYLLENTPAFSGHVQKKILDGFEKLFKDLNSLLPVD